MLTVKAFTQFTTGNDATDKALQNISDVVEPVLETPILDGTLVNSIVIGTTGKLTVNHGLGRPAQGYFVTAALATVSIPYVVPSDQKQPNTSLVLTFATGAGVTVSMWVF